MFYFAPLPSSKFLAPSKFPGLDPAFLENSNPNPDPKNVAGSVPLRARLRAHL